jgi:hypothetical protein
MRLAVLLLLCLLATPALAQVLPAAAVTPSDDTLAIPAKVRTSMGDAFADDVESVLEMKLLVQTRYVQTVPSSDRAGERALAQSPDGWYLNRAFVRLGAKPTSWLTTKLLFDFAALKDGDLLQTVKLAYATVQLHPRVAISAGLFKRPFSLLELLPIGEYEFGSNGPTDGLIKDIGFGGRDIGVLLTWMPLKQKKLLKASVGVFRGGRGEETAALDGLFAARLESTPVKHLHLGADAVWRRKAADLDYGTADGPQSDGWAWSADAIIDFPLWDIRAEMLGGDRTDVKNRPNPDFGNVATAFLGGWILGLYRIPVGSSVLMPGIRLEWLDSDRQNPVGNHFALSGSLNVDFDPRLRLLLDVTHQWVDPGTMPLGKKPNGDAVDGTFLAFHDVDYTRVLVQLQARL